jgi:LysR family transcriptional regulator, cyn operon transcriptional activator
MTVIKPGITELRHLRYFLAVANTGHFRRAALELRVSQPTLSHQIKQLELQMGATLFDRLNRRVRLTPAGEVLRLRALTILRELADARQAIAELQALESGHLSVGIVSTVNVSVLPEAVKRFRDHYPKVAVSVRELSMQNLETELIAGRLDLGISFISPRQEYQLESEPLFHERLVAVLPKNHPLGRVRKVPVSKVLDHPLVLLSPGYCTRELVDESVSALNLNRSVNPAIEMNSIEGVLSTVRQTGIATLLPNATVQWEKYSDLRVINLEDHSNLLPVRHVGLLWIRGGYRTSPARAFAQEVHAVVKELKIGTGF